MQDIILDANNIWQLILIVLFGVYGIILLVKARSVDFLEQRRFLIGLSGFSIGWGLTNLAFLYSNSYLLTDLVMYATLWKVASIIGIASLLCVILVIERYVVKWTRFLFTIVTLIGLVLIIIFPIEGTAISGARLTAYIFLPFSAASIVILYLYLIIKLSGKPRQETAVVFLGMLLIIIGYALDIELIKGYIPASLFFLDSLCMILGGFLITIIYYRRE